MQQFRHGNRFQNLIEKNNPAIAFPAVYFCGGLPLLREVHQKCELVVPKNGTVLQVRHGCDEASLDIKLT